MSQKSPFLVCRSDARVVYSVEEFRDCREDGRAEAPHVGVGELDAAAVEPHGPASHEDRELTAALQGVGEGEVGVEDVGVVGGELPQLEDGGTGGAHHVLVTENDALRSTSEDQNKSFVSTIHFLFTK